MSSIAGYTMFFVGGKLARMGEKVVDISRDGVDGHAFKLMSLKSAPSVIHTFRDFDSAGAAATAILAYKTLQGAAVTVVDEVGFTDNNVVVRRVDATVTKFTGTAVGGFASAASGRVVVRARWLLQTTQV